MNKNIINPDFQGIYFPNLKSEQICMVRRIDSASGTGEMNCFDVAPGIQISYNDLNMDSCFQPMKPRHDFLQIDHCLDGCYEFELEGGSISFLGEGDLCVTNLCRDKQVFVNSRMPLKRYRGITVLLEMETAQNTLRTDFSQAEINLEKIRDSLCGDGRSLLIKSKHEVDHIFSELYRVDERIQQPYFWLKIVELLLFLSLLDSRSMQRPQQFSEETSQKTQEIYQYIIDNPFDKLTITDFAKQFHVAESSMKRCFKSIAGVSIGTFMKVKKMEAAAGLLLSEQRLSIGEVAEAAGYENQGKFTVAFKSVHGVTPLAFRCKHW
jgi:AraC-like DNA-binding protein